MQSNSPRQLAGMLALAALLALGLAGCGGDEPAPVTAPAPAPAPAPPPFEPQSVEVALGSSGENVTLMTTEGGGFTLNGETVASGAEVMTEGGATYTLTLADGAWSAAFMPMAIEIPLGMSGDSVTVMTAEGGGVTLDGEPVTAGTRVMADNGATYQAGALPDGTLGAVYVPDTATVALGLHGGSVTLSLQEDRATWTDAGGAAVASGTMVMGNGRSYTLTLDGMEWSAAYDAVTATVALGASGASAVLTQAEDGSWWLGGSAFASGGTTTAGGNAYVLTLAGGVWSAAYSPSSMPIAGTGLTAVMNEDGSGYDVAGATLPASGMGDVTVDGAMYRVSMNADGMLAGLRFDAQRDAETAMVIGDLEALAAKSVKLRGDNADTDANENLTALQLAGQEFPVADLLGSGMASASGANFVETARAAIAKTRGDVAALLGLEQEPPGLRGILEARWAAVQAQVNGVFGTDANDDPMVRIGTSTPPNADLLDEIDDILAALSGADAFAAATAAGGNGVFEDAELSADNAMAAFARNMQESTVAFGSTGPTRYGAVVQQRTTTATTGVDYKKMTMEPVETGYFLEVATSSTEEDPRGLLGGFSGSSGDYSLNTVDGLLPVDAVRVDANGGNIEEMIKTAFERGTDEEDIRIREITASDNVPTGSHRRFQVLINGSPVAVDFGGAALIVKVAKRSTTEMRDVPPEGAVGAFSYSTVAETDRARYVQTAGNAYYRGGTRAVSGQGAEKLYMGDMEIEVRFRSNRVSGLVTNLRTVDGGEPWVYQFGEVDSIVLPGADLQTGEDAKWKKTGDASVTFATRAGSPPAQSADATFEGILSGGNGATAGDYASGTWSLNKADNNAGSLYGGFGVERVEDSPVSRPGLDDGSGAGAKVVPASGTAIADGMLKLTFSDNAMEAISLATLLDLGGGNHNENGAKWVDVARAAIEDIRSDLAALQNLETRLGDQEADKWTAFQNVLTNNLFGLNKIPERLSGVYDDDEALGLIDRALAGLASSSALADARAEGGIFKGFVSAGGVNAFWGRRQWRVQARMGSTDYTRFGVWHLQKTANAAEGWDSEHSDSNDGPNSFAYSPLGQTVYTSHEDPTYPGGGSATYMGGVMAHQAETVFAGDAEASVRWNANAVGGMLNVVLSNLADAGNGDPLMLQRHDVSDPKELVDLGALPLREIVLSGIMVGNKLAFNDMIGPGETEAPQVRISFQDRGMGEMDVTGHSSGMVAGKFVGKDIDGPLGVIGRFELEKMGTTGTTLKQIGDGTTIFGSFGAEVMP